MLNTDRLAKLLNENPDFAASGKFFDGSIQVEIGKERVWIKAFMGKVVLATLQPPPFGYTFCIKGSQQDWRFALGGAKNRLREAVVINRLKVEGNIIEYTRLVRAVHGLSEVLRAMILSDEIVLEPAA